MRIRSTRPSRLIATAVFATIAFISAGTDLALGDANTPSPLDPLLQTVFTESTAAEVLVSGQAALDAIGANLNNVAETNGVAPEALIAELLADQSLAADTNDNILYVDQESAAPVGGGNQPSGATTPALGFQPTLAEVFSLNSNAEADVTLFLDFDGHTTTDTYWNQWSEIETIVSPPYSLDDDYSSFSDEELRDIYSAWQVVAEDFAPFDVNVSTVEPPESDLLRNSGDPDAYGIRTVITNDPFTCGCGGLAYVNRFGFAEPAFVFNKSLQSTGETISHEVGHALGLTHDGDADSDYYFGHGGSSNPDSWAPIMGASFFAGYSQWDNGTYAGSNNGGDSGNMGRGGDDLAVIAGTRNGFGYRGDDHGSAHTRASALSGSGELLAVGVIDRTNDEDWFSFELSKADTVDLEVVVDEVRPNLNAALSVHDQAGVLLESSVYETRGAAIHDLSLAAGDYFVRVTSEGAEHYDTYATMGSYSLSVSGPSAGGTPTGTDGSDSEEPDPVTCAGHVATIVGTSGADEIVGTPGDDVIVSRGGNDTIMSGDGDDIICSGPGHDTVHAGTGNDIVYAGGGRDHVLGGGGKDWLIGGPGNDKLFGQYGNDKLSGLGGDDELSGNQGRDIIRGNAGNDRIFGHGGGDTLLGGNGRDSMFGGSGFDVMRGHGGADTMNGGPGNDRMFGGFGVDTMNGGTGNDFGDGMYGPDIGTNFETRKRFAD